MENQDFAENIRAVTAFCAGKPLDASLAQELERAFPADGEVFGAIESACRAAAEDGTMCQHGADPLRYGRVIKPGAPTHGFSVDVVYMNDVVGPHHRHPGGEIDMIMPLAAGAAFDGAPRGWLVYPPHSEHAPTVSGGDALVLYLLPNGEIDFTKR